MTTPVFWSLFAAAIVAVLAVVYGIGWGLTDCPRWFLPCQCRTNLPGPPGYGREPSGAGELQWSPPIRDTQNPGFWTDENYAKLAGPDAWDAWVQRDPDQAADQLIAEWHGEAGALERPGPGDVWDQFWANLDGLARECLLVHDWLVREERLWAELKAETRELCAA